MLYIIMEILELFSGFASWSKPWKEEASNKVITLDYDPKFGADLTVDILTWDYKNSGLKPDVIYASPDCTFFSNARARWGYPADKLDWTRSLWEKTFEIVEYFKPKYFIIENPVGKARKYFPLGHGTVDYCAYDYTVKDKNNNILYIKKPTDLWSNLPDNFFKRCPKNHTHAKDISKVIHTKAGRGRIPENLTMEIKNYILAH